MYFATSTPLPPFTSMVDEVTLPEDEGEEADGDESKLERSRRNARECRLRKKEYIGSLEAKVSLMESRDLQMQEQVNSAKEQLALLKAKHGALVRHRALSRLTVEV
jgi:hypothetical protein